MLYINDKELDELSSKLKKIEERKQNQENNLSQEEDSEKTNDLEETQSNKDLESTEKSKFQEINETLEEQKTPHLRIKQNNVLPLRINRYQIEEITKKEIKKNIFFKPKEIIQNIVLKYRAIYKIYYNLYDKEDNFKKYYCYVDSVTGEFIHFKNSNFKESKGLFIIGDLNIEDLDILFLLQKQQTLFSLSKEIGLKEEEIHSKFISKFKELKLITWQTKNNREIYNLSPDFDIPFNAEHKLLSSLDELPLRKEEIEFFEKIKFPTAQVQENLEKLWGPLEFISLEEIFWPIWHSVLIDKHNLSRELHVDGVIGKLL